MSSAEIQSDDNTVLRAAMASVFRTAFAHLDRVNVRALPALAELFGDKASAPPAVSPGFLEAVANTEHPDRLRTAPGPFVFIRDNADSYSPTFVPDMLGSERADIRKAAIEYLISRTGSVHWISPGTLAAIQEYRALVESEELDQWVKPACHLGRLVEGDFLLHLAGFQQLSDTTLDEAKATSWRRILRPSISSLLSISEDQYDVLRRTDQAKARLSDIVTAARSLQELVQRYCEVFGHMPFAAPYGLGDALSDYLGRAGTPLEEVQRDLNSLFDETRAPAARYHLLQAVISHPEWASEQRRLACLNETVKLVSLLVDAEHDQDAAEWTLRALLARYYMCYIELHGPSLDPGRTLCVAWWAADRVVASLMEHDGARPSATEIEDGITTAILPVVQNMEVQHWIGTPPIPPSDGRLLTLNLKYPWSLALLGQFLARREKWPMNLLTVEQEDTLSKAIAVYMSLGFCARMPEFDSQAFQFQSFSLAVARSWGQYIRDTESRNTFETHVEGAARLYEKTELLNVLEKLQTATSADAAVAVGIFRAMAHVGQLKLEEVWERNKGLDWARMVLSKGGPNLRAALADAFICLVHRESHECRCAIPHLFVMSLRESDVPEQDLFSWVLHIVAACLATGTFGALVSLMRGDLMRGMREGVGDAVRQLDIIAQTAPAEVRGWLREAALLLEGT